MSLTEIFPRIDDQSSAYLCENLSQKHSNELFRVPVHHRPLGKPGEVDPAFFASWPPLSTFNQLKEVLQQTSGLALFVPIAAQPHDDSKFATASLGSIVLLPQEAWDHVRNDFLGWQESMPEDAWHNVPYTIDDIEIFAGISFSPDCWFAVKRGSLAGQIFHWTHEGDCSLTDPWATDLHDWGRRVWTEIPEILGGVVRFDETDTDEPVPANAELFPLELISSS